jgi:hypothetical protein
MRDIYLSISRMSRMLFRARWRAGLRVLFCAHLHTLFARVAARLNFYSGTVIKSLRRIVYVK